MNPLFKYPGGKRRELHYIREYYPKYDQIIYIEPFVGGGAVYWDFEDADEYHINDISKELINIYKFTAEQDDIFINELIILSNDWDNIRKLMFDTEIQINKEKFNFFYLRKKNKMNKEDAILTSLKSAYFVTVRDLFNKESNDNKKSAYYLFIMTFAFSSLFQYNLRGELNIPYGGKGYNNKKFSSVVQRITSSEIIEKLSKTYFYNEPFDIFMNRFAHNKKVFAFIDPPYVSDMIYNGVRFSMTEQKKLSEISTTIPNQLSVIGEHEMIRELYKNFHIESKVVKFSISFKNRNEQLKENLYIINRK